MSPLLTLASPAVERAASPVDKAVAIPVSPPGLALQVDLVATERVDSLERDLMDEDKTELPASPLVVVDDFVAESRGHHHERGHGGRRGFHHGGHHHREPYSFSSGMMYGPPPPPPPPHGFGGDHHRHGRHGHGRGPRHQDGEPTEDDPSDGLFPRSPPPHHRKSHKHRGHGPPNDGFSHHGPGHHSFGHPHPFQFGGGRGGRGPPGGIFAFGFGPGGALFNPSPPPHGGPGEDGPSGPPPFGHFGPAPPPPPSHAFGFGFGGPGHHYPMGYPHYFGGRQEPVFDHRGHHGGRHGPSFEREADRGERAHGSHGRPHGRRSGPPEHVKEDSASSSSCSSSSASSSCSEESDFDDFAEKTSRDGAEGSHRSRSHSPAVRRGHSKKGDHGKSGRKHPQHHHRFDHEQGDGPGFGGRGPQRARGPGGPPPHHSGPPPPFDFDSAPEKARAAFAHGSFGGGGRGGNSCGGRGGHRGRGGGWGRHGFGRHGFHHPHPHHVDDWDDAASAVSDTDSTTLRDSASPSLTAHFAQAVAV